MMGRGRQAGPSGFGMLSWIVAAAALGVLWSSTPLAARRGEEAPVFHVVFSSAILGGVSHDDARASLQVWGTKLARVREDAVRVAAEIVDDMDVLRDRLRAGTVDFYAVRVDEYFELERVLPKPGSTGILFLGKRDGDVAERYVVIAHKASGFASLAATRGRSLVMIDGSRRGLAPIWLDTVLLEAGLAPTTQHFGGVVFADKAARVVLPVFFRQRDVGVVPEKALATATEMNPQVGRDLVVIARSEPIVGSVNGLRSDLGPERYRESVLASIAASQLNPSGQQLLAIFGMEGVVRANPQDLASARALVEKHARLVTRSGTRRAP